jgi:hypothetical protein
MKERLVVLDAFLVAFIGKNEMFSVLVQSTL